MVTEVSGTRGPVGLSQVGNQLSLLPLLRLGRLGGGGGRCAGSTGSSWSRGGLLESARGPGASLCSAASVTLLNKDLNFSE